MSEDQLDSDQVDSIQRRIAAAREQVQRRLVGQETVLNQALAVMLADGNALLESTPGLGKTMLVRTIADVTDLSFKRIQNTPDLMPSDITGTEIIRETPDGSREFVFEKGPIFANVVLADEINRATPKTQAALLEAMQERQVTAGGETRQLPSPFFVLATQNPIEQEGSLHPDESLYMNGRLWTAADALEYAKEHGEMVRDGRTRYYDLDATTRTLAADGELTETECTVYETEYDGEIYTFETKTGRKIRVSDNHPFLINREGIIRWEKARNLEPDDHLVTPETISLPSEEFTGHDAALDALEADGYEVVRQHSVTELVRKLDSGASLSAEEIDALRIAAELSKKDLASEAEVSYDRVCNFLQGTASGIGDRLTETLQRVDIEAGDYVESHRIHRIDDVLTDAEAGFFVGFILAEGSVRDGHVDITQKNLADRFDRWVRIAERIGLNVSIDADETGRTARIDSKPFVEYLDERFELRNVERLLSAPEAFKHSFLEIFLLTESHFDAERRRITFVQKDRETTNVIAHLLLEQGIVPWVYDREGRYELRVQGEDVATYLDSFEWRGPEPDTDEFESAHRTVPLSADTAARLVEVLGMKHDEPLAERSWYNSYNALQSKRDRMATAHFEAFVEDAAETLQWRRWTDIEEAVRADLGDAAKLCGLSLTDVVDETPLTKHRVWQKYRSQDEAGEAAEYVVDEFGSRIDEAERIVEYYQQLRDSDVFFDRIVSVASEPYEGPVIGLSVPETHNYLAGLGACGINHNTYALPEAQKDRFLAKILVDYPSGDEEREIVDRYTGRLDDDIPVERALSRDALVRAQELVREVPIADDIRDYAIQVVRSTREADRLEYGASPRASMGLVVTAKARAFMEGRNHVSEADIEAMARPVLRHRVIVDFRAEREGVTADDVIGDLL